MIIGKKLLKHIGVNPARLRLEWVSAGEGIRFANIMNAFGKEMEELGPLGKAEGLKRETLKLRLEGIRRLIPYIKLVQTASLNVPPGPSASGEEEEQRYHDFYESNEVNRVFQEAILDKFAISQIVSVLREGPRSTADIATALDLAPSEVSRHLNTSSRQGLVRFDQTRRCFSLA